MLMITLYNAVFWLPASLTYALIATLGLMLALCVKGLLEPIEDQPSLYYKNSDLARYVIKKTPRLSRPFKVPAWARNAHVQTILPMLLRKTEFQFERELVTMNDRGVVALDWGISGIDKLSKSSPILIVLCGLTGDAMGVAFLCKEAMKKGLRPVVFNKRGHGGSPLLTPKLQSIGDPSDLRQVVLYIQEKFQGAKLTMLGSSAGSGLLVSYLGEYGSSSYIVAAVCNCPGYDTEALFRDHLKQPYNFLLLRSLKRLVSRHSETLKNIVDMDKAMKSSTLQDFEERLYCKMYGYSNMSQYWENNNPMRAIDNITTPVLSINSDDDPICVKENVPIERFKTQTDFMLINPHHGGHCGFVEHGSLKSWADKVSIDYLKSVLDYINEHR